tara:strand:+ start:47 stop:268 length:222 start_codon:yes stop_codon:yes gene_type:complete
LEKIKINFLLILLNQIVMDSNEIYMKMAELWAEMSLEHSKPSKAAHGRARSAATKIKKLIGEYKKASVAEDKA